MGEWSRCFDNLTKNQLEKNNERNVSFPLHPESPVYDMWVLPRSASKRKKLYRHLNFHSELNVNSMTKHGNVIHVYRPLQCVTLQK